LLRLRTVLLHPDFPVVLPDQLSSLPVKVQLVLLFLIVQTEVEEAILVVQVAPMLLVPILVAVDLLSEMLLPSMRPISGFIIRVITETSITILQVAVVMLFLEGRRCLTTHRALYVSVAILLIPGTLLIPQSEIAYGFVVVFVLAS